VRGQFRITNPRPTAPLPPTPPPLPSQAFVSSSGAYCTNRSTRAVVQQARDWFWPLGALYVSYWPLGGKNCDSGVVQIETATYHRLYQQAYVEHLEDEPQL
jgi:hypothetical protein